MASGKSIDELILKYSLQNAVKFDGKASAGAVIGKVLSEDPGLKKKAKEIGKNAAAIIKKVNSMKAEEQLSQLKETAPELLEKKPKKDGQRDIFAFLGIKKGEKVLTAFPPEPSKYPHIGHAKALLLNYELAKQHKGKFILRFEDTNPKLAKEEFYRIHLDDYRWLGIKPGRTEYASDCMKKFYECAEKVIRSGNAYVCTCEQEAIRKNRAKGLVCECRSNNKETNMRLWKGMFKAEEGKSILRMKIDMKHKNSAMRDPAIARIIEHAHPRTGKRYRLWPAYDFENAVMDGIEGITHRLRSKEFELRNELQRHIQKKLGFRETRIFEFARFNLKGVVSSGRVIREKIEKGELSGWDDPSLTTLVALKRRGFLPEAIKEFLLKTGITKAESTLTWDDLIVHNRRMLDAECNRHFFIRDPVKIKVEGCDGKTVKIKKHPDFNEKGFREFRINDEFCITKDDYNSIKKGKLYRLMHVGNFIMKEKNRFVFDSADVGKYRKEGERIFHWLPCKEENVNAEVLMPDGTAVKGIAEKDSKDIKTGEIVQFERFGFCRLDGKDKILKFWFTHS